MLKKITFLLLIWVSHSSLVPPPPDNVALMARYIIHSTDWVSIATISTQSNIKGYPFVSLKSFSDGPVSNGTGVPYLYMTTMDVSGKDIEVNNKVTIMASLAETDYCESKDFDPQDPRCAKVIISGRLLKVPQGTPEYTFGRDALYARHPSMKYWPLDHNFYVAYVDIEQIEVLDYFGGIKLVSKNDYFNASLLTKSQKREQLLYEDTYFPQVGIIDVPV